MTPMIPRSRVGLPIKPQSTASVGRPASLDGSLFAVPIRLAEARWVPCSRLSNKRPTPGNGLPTFVEPRNSSCNATFRTALFAR